MRVLVLGSGGREHALAWAIARSEQVEQVISAPGSPGMAQIGRVVPLDLGDLDAVVACAKSQGADLVVVGKVRRVQKGDGGTSIITINRGRKHGITRDWVGRMVDARGNPLSKTFKLIKVSSRQSVAKVSWTPDQVKMQPRVELTPTP